ncbi:MAG: hypothetical protein ACT4QF_22400 [Sporichthyaceae bacterium]
MVIDDDRILIGVRAGVVVRRGAKVDVRDHQGSIVLEPGSSAVVHRHQGSLSTVDAEVCIVGSHQGSLSVGPGARVIIRGAHQGSVTVHQGGTVEVAHGGALQGSLHVDGQLTNSGKRAGSVSGAGLIEDVDDGYAVPGVVRNGITYYG